MRGFVVFAYLLVISSFAQARTIPDGDDSLDIIIAGETVQMERNLDSLLNLWYVQNAFSAKENFYVAGDTTLIYSLPDSIIIQRLRNMDCYIEMTYNDVVRKYIEMYSGRFRKQVEVMLGLSEYYFPMFEAALDKYGLPYELKYLPIIESALNPRAVSRAGASGLWQFMYTTGKLYKLNVNSYVDDRLDPYKSSQAAALYLKDLYDIYHDWHLVIAAYNCGPGNVNKAIKRSGKTTYWGIYDYLPRETRGYVPAFIGAAYAMHYYQENNLTPKKVNYPVITDTIMVSQELHLGQVSEVLGLSMEVLRDLNPQYKKDILPAGTDTLPLRLPQEFSTSFIGLSDSIFNYKDSVYFGNVRPTQYNSNKTTTSGTNTTTTSGGSNTEMLMYKVKSGESLGIIADRFNVSLADLKSWNGLSKNTIHVGQKLAIFVPSDQADKYRKLCAGTTQTNQTTTTNNTNQQGNNNGGNKAVNLTPRDDSQYVWYTVKSGDNFWSIAKKYPGVTNTDIMKLNNISDPSSLRPGQKLKIMKK